MKIQSALIVPAVLLIAGSSASAQSMPTWTPFHTVDWDGTELGEGRLVTRMVAGEFSPDHRTDVIAQGGPSNQRLLIIEGIATNEGEVLFPTGVKDFDLAPAGADGTQDLIVLDSSGLHLVDCTIHATTGVREYPQTTISNASPWTTNKMVRTARLNSGTATDYIGLGSNLKTIHILHDGTTATSFLPGPRVYAIVPGDYTGDAKQEIALLTQTGVLIVDDAGNVLASVSEAYTSASLLGRLPVAASGLDALAWITRPDESTTSTLRVITVAGGVLSSRAFTDTEFTAVSGGQANGDGRPDLLIATPDVAAPVLLRNTGTASVPEFTGAVLSPLSDLNLSAPLVNVAAPLLADLTRDGVSEIVVPECTTGRATFHMFRAGYVNQYLEIHPVVIGGEEIDMEFLPNAVNNYCDQDGVIVTGTGATEFGFFSAAPPAGNDIFLEVRVWKRDMSDTNYLYQHCQERTVRHKGNPDVNGMWRVTEVTLGALDDSGSGFTAQSAICWVETRWIQVGGEYGTEITDANILQAWPTTTVAAFTCAPAVFPVSPAAYDPNIHFRIQASYGGQPPTCVPGQEPSGTLGSSCIVDVEGTTQMSVVSQRLKPRPRPNITTSVPVAAPIKDQMGPFLPD